MMIEISKGVDIKVSRDQVYPVVENTAAEKK